MFLRKTSTMRICMSDLRCLLPGVCLTCGDGMGWHVQVSDVRRYYLPLSGEVVLLIGFFCGVFFFFHFFTLVYLFGLFITETLLLLFFSPFGLNP